MDKESGGMQSTGVQRVGQYWSDLAHTEDSDIIHPPTLTHPSNSLQITQS